MAHYWHHANDQQLNEYGVKKHMHSREKRAATETSTQKIASSFIAHRSIWMDFFSVEFLRLHETSFPSSLRPIYSWGKKKRINALKKRLCAKIIL